MDRLFHDLCDREQRQTWMDKVPGAPATKQELLHEALLALTLEQASLMIRALIRRDEEHVYTRLAQLGYFDAIEAAEKTGLKDAEAAKV